jgi:hypothetical protein
MSRRVTRAACRHVAKMQSEYEMRIGRKQFLFFSAARPRAVWARTGLGPAQEGHAPRTAQTVVVKASSSSYAGRVTRACRRRVEEILVETVETILAPFAEDRCPKRRGGGESERAKERAERKRHRARVEPVPVSHSASTSARCLPFASTRGALSPYTRFQNGKPWGIGVQLHGAPLALSARAASRLARPRPI